MQHRQAGSRRSRPDAAPKVGDVSSRSGRAALQITTQRGYFLSQRPDVLARRGLRLLLGLLHPFEQVRRERGGDGAEQCDPPSISAAAMRRPAPVTGKRSPYPTVVMVVIAHQAASP